MTKQKVIEGGENKEIKVFANFVLKDMGFKGWKIKWANKGTDSICICKTKEIHMGNAWLYGVRVTDSKYYVLHEIAHIRTDKDCKHGKIYQKELLFLIDKYLVNERGQC